MTSYKVYIKATFTAAVWVEAESEDTARDLAAGVRIGGAAVNPEGVKPVDWEIDTQAKTEVLESEECKPRDLLKVLGDILGPHNK